MHQCIKYYTVRNDAQFLSVYSHVYLSIQKVIKQMYNEIIVTKKVGRMSI